MLHKRIFAFFGAMIIVAALIMPLTASASEPFTTYTYSYNGVAKISPDAFYTLDVLDLKLSSPGAVYVDSNENIYIADTGNNAIVILDRDFSHLHTISGMLSRPSGVFATNDGDVYIADTDNNRILHLNSDYEFVRDIIPEHPTMLPDDYAFRPHSVVVDMAGRIYSVDRSEKMGVLQFNPAGEFTGFIGAQQVRANPIDLIWRVFSTPEQRARMLRHVPTEYNNIDIDERGFLYVTTDAISAIDLYWRMVNKIPESQFMPLKKLNPSGIDVLNRNGFFPPAGDIANPPSRNVDVSIRPDGIYSLLDNNRNKIFTYNDNGDLLHAFGTTGTQRGSFQDLISIAYKGDTLLALDGNNGSLTVFAPTQYGQKIFSAISSFNNLDYEQATRLWHEILSMNSNLDMAYLGIAQGNFFEGNYREAMNNFRMVNDVWEYSKAFRFYRNEVAARVLLLIPIAAGLFIFAAVRFYKFAGAVNGNIEMPESKVKRLGKQIMYSIHTCIHPLDGFWDIKREGRGSLPAAIIINMLALFAFIFSNVGGGYIYNPINIVSVNIINTVANFMLPVFLWCVANWCLTTLMDGEGTFKQVYITTAYSLTPLILILPAATILTYFLSLEEMFFPTFFMTIAYVWMAILVFLGMLTIHDYTFTKNIVVTILTLVGMAILMFIAMLFFDLFLKMITFFHNLYREWNFRT